MKANPEWVAKWSQDPQARVAVIVHVHGDPQQHVEAVSEGGLSVTRTFRLTNTIAAAGPAHCALTLLDAPWVHKVEPDQRITAMNEGSNR